MNILKHAALALASLLASTAIQAQTTSQVYGDTITKQTHTFFITGETDWTTYNSQVVKGNTSDVTTGYTIGGYSGERRVLGVILDTTYQKMDFGLTDSRIVNSWSDLRLEARFGYLFPSIGASLSEMKIIQDDEVVLDAFSRGINAGLSVKVPVTTWMMVDGKVMVVKNQSTQDKAHRNASLGIRQEADLHASFDLTQNFLDFLVGYRARRVEMELAGEKFHEVQSAPYAGLRLGAYF